ncbi:MAG: hypothetical protein ABIQ51_04160 [Mesorhizobium sp.]|uniref:hypothetical protein n=1 Tax=Mesorhizobium sp. INR15 TaxID=2654248 RepID=UPI0018964ACF|nr:hypothetical protein [Mesorhizobium sp. INR15]QPC95801.1 hypothetical protein GA829_35195 [Mesorhizobium sp. INR15]
MPNTTVQAAAEGLPSLNRRTALAFTGAGLIASLAGVAAAAAKPSPTAALIEAHKAARVRSETAWVHIGNLIDANPWLTRRSRSAR